MEEVVDLIVGGEEPCAWPADLNCFICRSRRRVGWCEFSALLLSPLCWRCSMPVHDLAFGRTIAGKFVGDHDAWRSHLLLQQLAQQPLGRLFVASALDQNIEHD